MSTWLVSPNELTAEQIRAIELSPHEHGVILGSPGSGKTQILLHRARYLCDKDEHRRLIEILKVRLAKGEKIAKLLAQKRQVYGFANGLREAGLEVETPAAFNFATDLPKTMPFHSAKGLTFETVLMPRLVPKSFAQLSESRIERLLFVGITRATKWVYMSTTGNSRFPPLEKLVAAASKGCLTVQLPRQAGIDRIGKDKASQATTEDELTNLLRIGRFRRPALVTELGKVTVP